MMMRVRMPLAFHVNTLAMALFCLAFFVRRAPWHLALQWLGGAALLCAIVLLILRK
jgi:hypothetical protein